MRELYDEEDDNAMKYETRGIRGEWLGYEDSLNDDYREEWRYWHTRSKSNCIREDYQWEFSLYAVGLKGNEHFGILCP